MKITDIINSIIRALNLKAVDTTVVHNTTDETIHGVKTFISGIVAPSISGNANTASVLQSGRNITVSNDATSVPISFNGSADITIPITLSNTGVVAGTVNTSSSMITPFTIDSKGRITNTETAINISPSYANIQLKPTTLSGLQLFDLTGMSTVNPIMDSITTIGISTLAARADHIHPSDTSKASLSGATFSGAITGTTFTGTSFNSITALSSTSPIMASTATIGTSTTVARADHIHPSDTSKAPINNPTFTGTVTGINASMVGLGNLSNIQQLPYSQTLSITGDFTAPITNLNTGTIAGTLVNSGVTPGTYNNGTSITPFTIDSKGRITNAGTAINVTPNWTNITSKPTTITGFGINMTGADISTALGYIPANSSSLVLGDGTSNDQTLINFNTGTTLPSFYYSNKLFGISGDDTVYLKPTASTNGLSFIVNSNSTTYTGAGTLSTTAAAQQFIYRSTSLNSITGVRGLIQGLNASSNDPYMGAQWDSSYWQGVTLINSSTGITDIRINNNNCASNFTIIGNGGTNAYLYNYSLNTHTFTGNISAPSFIGNASTSTSSGTTTKLSTARNINLIGDQTGSASFDGSSDINITTSLVSANLLTKLKTVDGSGSGLDADLLDGHDSTYFQPVLVSGTSVKTINSSTILGSGDISTVSGTVNSVQFNNNGVPGGATNVVIDNGDLLLNQNDSPIAPASGNVKVFCRSIAGRGFVGQIGSSGLSTALQPILARNKVGYWNPPGNATTVPGVFAITAPTAVGTATSRSVASTNIATRMRRLGYVSSATAGNLSGQYTTVAQFTTGTGTNLGGFTYICRFITSDAAVVSSARCFIGMSSNISAPTNIEPSTQTNSIGLSQLSTDSTQWYIAYGGSAAQTSIALGTSLGSPTDVTTCYEIALFCPPSLNGVINYQVANIGTGVSVSGIITPGTPGTQTPASATLLAHRAWRSNNTTAKAVGIDICSYYLETDQ